MKLSITALTPATASFTSAFPPPPPPPPHHAFDWGTLRCPPSSSNTTLPTPTYGFSSRLWTICTELIIHAPPHIIYDALLDYKSYHRWNTFVTRVFNFPANVTSTPEDAYVGMPMTFTVAGLPTDHDPTTESVEVVTVLQPRPVREVKSGYTMNAWRSDTYFDVGEGKKELVVAEHPNILIPVKGTIGEVWTRYISYETYYQGDGGEGVFPLRGRLQDLFERQGRDLKAYVEGECQGQ